MVVSNSAAGITDTRCITLDNTITKLILETYFLKRGGTSDRNRIPATPGQANDRVRNELRNVARRIDKGS